MDRDFSAGGRNFKLNKIDAFKQFHIVRRLGPIIGDIIPVAKKLAAVNTENKSEDQKFEDAAELIKPIMAGLSQLSDEDSNRVLLGLLSSVEVQQEPAKNWAFIAKGDLFMIQDIDLPVLLQVAGRAFMYNLAGFFAIAPQTSHGGQ
jgi:hypothetical protein